MVSNTLVLARPVFIRIPSKSLSLVCVFSLRMLLSWVISTCEEGQQNTIYGQILFGPKVGDLFEKFYSFYCESHILSIVSTRCSCKFCHVPQTADGVGSVCRIVPKFIRYTLSALKYENRIRHTQTVLYLLLLLCFPIRCLATPKFAALDPSSFSSRWKIMSIVSVVLFVIGSLLAAAETAATTLWPWKLKELAESSGPDSSFQMLEKDITRFLTTILVASTTVMVFVTAFSTEAATKLFGDMAFGYTSALMTIFFLFFGEILPKSLAVSNPVLVLRATLPIVSFLSLALYPIGKLFAVIAKIILRLFRITVEDTTAVSEEELRLIAASAGRSGSIERYEQDMIEGVLDLEETKVCEIMCPRVEMVSISANASLKVIIN